MKRVILFDLSEVLIAGLLGVEQMFAPRVSAHPDSVLAALGGELLDQLCRAELTENQYLDRIIASKGWNISMNEVKSAIRENFHRRIEGMDEILEKLSNRHELFLISDHAREWAEYIREIHPFLAIFRRQFFSFELKQTKREPATFLRVLNEIHREPQDCLLIDDSQRNVASAASVGVDGIRFENVEALSRALSDMNLL